MLRWFRKTYPSYNLQPLLLKRYRELEEARAFNVKRRQGDVPWDAVHRTLKLQYQPRRKVYTDDAVIAEPV